MSDELHKYHCTIRPGLAVQCTVNMDAIRRQEQRQMIVMWDGKLKRKDIPKYKEWMSGIYQETTDKLGKNMMWVLTPGAADRHGEIWVFEPGKPPFFKGPVIP